jgi:Membrane bound O-acyl transferase family
MLRQSFSSPANFLAHDVLRLTEHRLTARYTKLLATFFVSGLMHMAVDMSLGMPPSESGSVRFFCTQALGIMFEDGMQAICRSARRRRGGSSSNASAKAESQPPTNWARALGYVWVLAFMSWSTPVWVYPAIWMNKGEEAAKDALLPFSVVRMLLLLLPRAKSHHHDLLRRGGAI